MKNIFFPYFRCVLLETLESKIGAYKFRGDNKAATTLRFKSHPNRFALSLLTTMSWFRYSL